MTVRWITPKLGTSPWETSVYEIADAVVDVRGLVDRRGNSISEIARLIAETENHLRAGQIVVVCCDHGVSRSNAIAAAAIARVEKADYSSAVARVIEATREREIKLGLLDDVREALGTDDSSGISDDRVGPILISGADHFVGRALRIALPAAVALNDEFALLRNPARLEQVVRASGARCFVHLARPVIQDTNEGLGQALTLLRNVLEVCHSLRTPLVFLSGHQLFSGYRSDWLLASEALPAFPAGAVGETLYLCERLVALHTGHHGLRSLVVRPSTLYGPGDGRRSFLRTLVERVLRKEELIVHRYRSGPPRVELLHVRDFAAGLAMAIECEATGTLHFGSGSGIDTPSLAVEVCRLAGIEARVRHLDLAGAPSNVVLDSTRARESLGWGPMISLDEGLRELITTNLMGDAPVTGNAGAGNET